MKRFSKNIYTSIFIGPAVLVLFVFSVIPILIALGIIFTDMDLIGLSYWSSIQFLFFFVFSVFSILIALGISFTYMDLIGLADWSSIQFSGIDNYIDLFTDSRFISSIFNTLFYALIGVPLVIVCSLSIALLLNYGTSKLFSFFRMVYF